MAISIDALLAVIVFIALISFISTEPLSEMPVTQSTTAANQLVDDAIAAMDNTGFIMQSIESAKPYLITDKLEGLLPANIGYRVEMTKYESPVDRPGDQCRDNMDFATCFPEDGNIFYVTDLNVPEDREVFHGRKILIKKEPGDCALDKEYLAGLDKDFAAMFLGNYAPEARDVNITTGATCDTNRSPCPATDDTMRCCYDYYDEDGNPEIDAEYTWYKYDSLAAGDGWVIEAGETGQTVSGMLEDERWKCSARVSDGEWSKDANSALAIVGGPCFQFSSTISPEPITCGTTSNIEFSISGESGGRKDPVDIILTIDRSGSMSWNDEYNGAGTEESLFIERGTGIDTAYLGTSTYVYKLDMNNQTGSITLSATSPELDYAYDLYVSGDYVFVADNDNGLTILNKSDMSLVRTIGEAGSSNEITTGRGVYVSGNYAYMAAAGTYVEGEEKKYGAQMTSSRDDDERIGYNSSQSWVAQEFKPGVSDLNGVAVEMRRYGNPGDLTMHIRSSISGADLETITVDAGDVSTSWDTWLDIPIPGEALAVNPNDTYYLVFTTTSQSTSNYYRWGTREGSSNSYSGGELFRCTSGGSCDGLDVTSWFSRTYEDSRFRIYTYASVVGGLVVVDISDADPSNWDILSNLYNTGSGLIDQPQDVVISGNYAYLVDNGGVAGDAEGLWVIDITTPESPSFVGFEATSNAYGVQVSGNYAYVTDQGGDFHIIDVQTKSNPSTSVTFSNLGTVEDVYVDGTTAYVSANNVGPVPTSIGVHVIDISDPPNATKTETFYSSYSGFGRMAVGTNFLLVTNDSRGLTSIHKLYGTKMNSARDSAIEFVNYDEWTDPQDHLGAVSYGSDLNLVSGILEATSANKAAISAHISYVESVGSTDMTGGLGWAIDELLLNGTSEAIQFIVMLSDGECTINCLGLNTQIQRAEDNEIYVFTIGFGGDVDEDELQGIADGAYCPDKPTGNCGSYHHASNPDALSDVYQLIAGRIAELTGKMPDSDSAEISMVFDGFEGLELSNFSPAYSTWDEITLTYENLDIRNEWTGNFDVLIPCNYEDCEKDFLEEDNNIWFPPVGTTVSYTIQDEEQDAVNWPSKFMSGGELYYSDLSIEFVTGLYHGTDDSEVEYKITNSGYNTVDLSEIAPTINFYKDDDNPLEACEEPLDPVGIQNIEWDLNAAFGDNAGPDTNINRTTDLVGSGYLCLWLNKDQNPIVDCNANNRIVVHCDVPETYVYILDYWAWGK